MLVIKAGSFCDEFHHLWLDYGGIKVLHWLSADCIELSFCSRLLESLHLVLCCAILEWLLGFRIVKLERNLLFLAPELLHLK